MKIAESSGPRKYFSEKKLVLVCIAAVFLFIFVLQYSGRSIDNSRLSNWNDAFENVNPLFIYLILVASVFMSGVIANKIPIDRYPVPFLFILSYAVSIFFWKEPEVIIDASRYITEAKQLRIYGIQYFFEEWGGNISVWTDLPAIPFLYGLIFRFISESRLIIQVFNTLLFSTTVILTYLTGKELWDNKTGFNAGLFLLGIPYLYTQVPLFLVDMATMFFLILSVLTFLLAVKKGGIMIPVSAISIFSAFFCKYSSWLMLSVLVIIGIVILFQKRKSGASSIALRLMIIGFLTCLMVSVAIAFKHDSVMRQIQLLLEYQKPGLGRWEESLPSIFLFQVHPVITLAGLFSCYIAVKKKDLSFIIAGWLVFLVLVLDIRRLRYIIPVFPMLSIMASYGITQAKDKMLPALIPVMTTASSIVIAVMVFLPFLSGISAANLMSAGRYLDNIDIDHVELIVLSSEDPVINLAAIVPIVDLYVSKNIRFQYDSKKYSVPKDIDTSSLRFTWTYRNPEYYQAVDGSGLARGAVAIISDTLQFELTDELRQKTKGLNNIKSFNKSDSYFISQTFVTVYH